jgi:hypothetical protein
VQLKLHLLDEMRDIGAVNAFDGNGPLVRMVGGHTARPVVGVDGNRDVAVDYRSVDTDALDAQTEGEASVRMVPEKRVWRK